MLYHNNTSNWECCLNKTLKYFGEFLSSNDLINLFSLNKSLSELKFDLGYPKISEIEDVYLKIILNKNIKIKIVDKKLKISTSELDISNYSDLKILQKFSSKDLLVLHIDLAKQISYLFQLSNLRKIRFGDNFNQNTSILSSLKVLESIQFGDKFNKNIESLSSLEVLESIQFGHNFNQNINSLSSNLRKIRFGNNFNQKIDKLSSLKVLKSIQFGDNFNQDIESLSSLKVLELLIFGHNFNQKINSLSKLKNLKHIFLGYNFNQNTDVLLGLRNLELVLFEKKFVDKDLYVDFRDFISNNYDNYNYKNSCLNKFNQIFKGINSYYPLSSSLLACHDNDVKITKYFKKHTNGLERLIKNITVNSEYIFSFDDFYHSIYKLQNDLDYFSKCTLYNSKNELELIIDSLNFKNVLNLKVPTTKLPITKLSFKSELSISQLLQVLDRCDLTKLKILDLNNIKYLNDYISFPNILRYLTFIECIKLMINLEKLDLGKFQVKNYIIDCLSKLVNLKTLRFVGYITNNGFSYLSNLINLKELHCEGNELTNNGFLHLSKLINLEVLSIKNSTTDTGINNLSKLTKLTALNLENCLFPHNCPDNYVNNIKNNIINTRVDHLTNASINGLLYLSELTNLKTLGLSECNTVTDITLLCLSKYKNIERLNLSKCNKITDTELLFLSNLTNLKTLVLESCNKITDTGLKHLSKLINLELLDISQCNLITDKKLVYLSELKNLKFIKV